MQDTVMEKTAEFPDGNEEEELNLQRFSSYVILDQENNV